LRASYVTRRIAAGALRALAHTDSIFAIYDSQGRLLAEKPAGVKRLALLPPDVVFPQSGIYIYTQPANPLQLSGTRRVAVQRLVSPGHQGEYKIAGSQSLDPLLAQLYTIRRAFFVAVPVVLFLAGSSGWFLVKRSLAPVAVMSERTRRLSAAFLQQRQFMADATHKLRTPVSVIQTATAVALDNEHRHENEYRSALRLRK
jgi:signal transduction histidine kinase